MSGRREPLIAVVASFPLVSEALTDALGGLGECRTFSTRDGDLGGLLRWLDPDAVVIDDDAYAEPAEAWARETGTPLVCICMRTRQVRAFADGGWTEPQSDTPAAVRALVAAGLTARRALA